MTSTPTSIPTSIPTSRPDRARSDPPARHSPVHASPSRRRQAGVVIGAALLAALPIGAGTYAIRLAAQAAPRPPAAAVPVVPVLVLDRQDGHDVQRAYAARVEPQRQAGLAFETGGTLIEVAVEEGDRMPAGSVLARLDTRLLEAKRDRLAAARDALDSDVELAALALERQRTLKQRGFAADEALDEARLTTVRLRSRIAEADAGLALVDVELDKAALRAPFDALVGQRFLDPGATVAPGAPVLALLQADSPRLRVGLPPERAATLTRGQTYRFRWNEQAIEARMISVRADIDARTRTVSALFEPLDSTDEMTPAPMFGALLELVLTERMPGAVFQVPLAALAEDERGLWSVLAIVPADGPEASDTLGLQRTSVQIVRLSAERAVISAALADGARIVADGRHRVVDGERVRIAPSADALPPSRRDGAQQAHDRLAIGQRGS